MRARKCFTEETARKAKNWLKCCKKQLPVIFSLKINEKSNRQQKRSLSLFKGHKTRRYGGMRLFVQCGRSREAHRRRVSGSDCIFDLHGSHELPRRSVMKDGRWGMAKAAKTIYVCSHCGYDLAMVWPLPRMRGMEHLLGRDSPTPGKASSVSVPLGPLLRQGIILVRL